MGQGIGLGNLFDEAVDSGVITPETSSLLSGNLGSVVVAGAAGKPMEDILASDVTLVTVLLDESSSIAHSNLEQAVRDGYNLLLDAFATSRESDNILMALWTFHSEANVVHSYVPVEEAARLDASNYSPQGATCLYDTWCDALASNIAYAQQLRDSGTPCRSIVVVITDGDDVGSRRKLRECEQISTDLLASEQFSLAFVGVGKDASFQRIAKRMGVPANCIEVQKNATAANLRHVFQMVSQSAIRVSQTQILPGEQVGFFR